nr:FecR family protein [Chitinophaga rhizophila]
MIQQQPTIRAGAGIFVLLSLCCSLTLLPSCQQLGNKPVLSTFQEQGQTYTTFEGVLGERKTITLPDGAPVILNSNTRLLVPADYSRSRTLLLDGEAYFDSTAFPLTVKTNILIMTAKVPSSFKIRCFEAQQGATGYVLNGEVTVTKSYHSNTDNQPEVLARGNMVLANKEIDLMEKETYHAAEMEAWLQDKLVLNGEPFMNAVRKLEEWFSTEIYVDGNASAAGEIQGEFNGASLSKVLDELKQKANFSYKMKKNKVMIKF